YNFVLGCQPQAFSFERWEVLNALEMARGAAQGRPRIKFTTIAEMIRALEAETPQR
ncbi:MAG: hypothetical protein HC915_12970, partial [Anaerolineae bacterium]|nr:hypothetical protein [Anaerolineae bacterium]